MGCTRTMCGGVEPQEPVKPGGGSGGSGCNFTSEGEIIFEEPSSRIKLRSILKNLLYDHYAKGPCVPNCSFEQETATGKAANLLSNAFLKCVDELAEKSLTIEMKSLFSNIHNEMANVVNLLISTFNNSRPEFSFEKEMELLNSRITYLVSADFLSYG